MDRRKSHPEEVRAIWFYEDNNKSKKIRKNFITIVADFSISGISAYMSIEEFNNKMLNFMSKKYGSFDKFKNNELEGLRKVFIFMLKQDGGYDAKGLLNEIYGVINKDKDGSFFICEENSGLIDEIGEYLGKKDSTNE